MTENASSQPGAQPFIPAPPEPEPGAVATEAVVGAPVTAAGAPAGAAPAGTTRPRGAAWVNIALAVAIAVAIGGIGFAAGRMTAPASTAGAGNGNGGRVFGNGTIPGNGYFPGGFPGDGNNGAARGFFGNGGGSIEGTVESMSGDTLTLKLADGSTIQVSLSGATTYHSQAAAASSDVKTGGKVIVRIQLERGQGQAVGVTPSASDVTIVP